MVLPIIGAIAATVVGGAMASSAQKKAQRAQSKALDKQQAAAERQIDEQNEYNDPVMIRERAELAGFNPLAFIGPGVGNQHGVAGVTGIPNFTGASPMGDAVANIGMMLSDYAARNNQSAGEADKLRTENEKLIQELQRQTIRPMIGGVYDQVRAEGGGRMIPSGVGLPAPTVGPPGYTLASDQRVHAITGGYGRDVEHAPVTTGAGLTVIDNSMLSGPMSIPGDDGEPWGADELATAIIVGVPQLGYHWINNRLNNQGKRAETWRENYGIANPERFPDMKPWQGY